MVCQFVDEGNKFESKTPRESYHPSAPRTLLMRGLIMFPVFLRPPLRLRCLLLSVI